MSGCGFRPELASGRPPPRWATWAARIGLGLAIAAAVALVLARAG